MSYTAFADYGTYDDDAIPCVVLGQTEHRARIEHRCSYCPENTFSPGSVTGAGG